MCERGTPRLSAEQVVRVLKQHAIAVVGQSGSHQKWRNDSTGKQVIVAYRRGRILPLGTLKSIRRPAGRSSGDFDGATDLEMIALFATEKWPQRLKLKPILVFCGLILRRDAIRLGHVECAEAGRV